MHAATFLCSLFTVNIMNISYSVYWTYRNVSVFSHFIISLSVRVFLHHGRPPIHACVCISVCGHVSCCVCVCMRVCVCVVEGGRFSFHMQQQSASLQPTKGIHPSWPTQ